MSKRKKKQSRLELIRERLKVLKAEFDEDEEPKRESWAQYFRRKK